MHKSFVVTQEDKNKILGMHESATKRQYLGEQFMNQGSTPIKPKPNITSTSAPTQTTQSQTTGCIDGDCENGTGTYVYDNGKYTGQFKDGFRNGTGTYVWNRGDKYTGKWKDGSKNGLGTYVYDNGKYTGQWKDDMKNGTGTFFWADGRKYTGQWKDEEANGVGEYVGKNGYIWKGNFKDGAPVGTTWDILNSMKPNNQQYTTQNDIVQIQKMLQLKGYSVGKYGADGKLGNDTANAILSALQNAGDNIPDATTINQGKTP